MFVYPLSISHLEKGRKGTNLGCTQFKINLAPGIRYMQKQREDPEIHWQHHDKWRIENTQMLTVRTFKKSLVFLNTISAIGIGFNGAETNCGIARILGILLMNSCDT